MVRGLVGAVNAAMRDEEARGPMCEQVVLRQPGQQAGVGTQPHRPRTVVPRHRQTNSIKIKFTPHVQRTPCGQKFHYPRGGHIRGVVGLLCVCIYNRLLVNNCNPMYSRADGFQSAGK